jgi:hypothetical protein
VRVGTFQVSEPNDFEDEEDTMEKPSKKLTLSKETLRSLDDDKLDDVVGGVQSEGICVGQSVACDSVVCNSGALCST